MADNLAAAGHTPIIDFAEFIIPILSVDDGGGIEQNKWNRTK